MKFKTIIYEGSIEYFEDFMNEIKSNKDEIIYDISYCALKPLNNNRITLLVGIKYDIEKPKEKRDEERNLTDELLNMLTAYLLNNYPRDKIRISNLIRRHITRLDKEGSYSFWDLETDVFANGDFCDIQCCGAKTIHILRNFIASTKIKYNLWQRTETNRKIQ